MKVICWDCWNYSVVKSELDSTCKKCGSPNIIPIGYDVLFEYGPDGLIELFGVQSKWEAVNIIKDKPKEKMFIYKAFWINPVLQRDYDEVFFIVKVDKHNPSNYKYGIVYKKGDEYFECISKCKKNHIQKPSIKKITEEEFKKLTTKTEQ